MGVGQRLRQARESIGISQAAVALSLVPTKQRSSIGRYESGHDEPSLDTVAQLAAVLNVSPCWLAWGCEHMRNPGMVGMVSSDNPQTQKADVVLINEADHAK